MASKNENGEQRSRSFSDELHGLVGRMVSSLQELHEADMQEVVSNLNLKIKALESQLEVSQSERALPHQNIDGFEACCSPLRPLNNDQQIAAPAAPESIPPALPAALVDTTELHEGKRLSVPESITDAVDDSGQTQEVASLALHRSDMNVPLREVWGDAKQEAIMLVTSRCNFEISENAKIMGLSRKSAAETLRKKTFSRAPSMKSTRVSCNRCLQKSSKVMHPVGPLRFFWNSMSLLFITYDLLVVPMSAFDVDDAMPIQVAEWILCCWWTFDICMSFRTGYIIGTRIEMRPTQVACRYIRTWFFLDLTIVVLEWISRFAVALGSVSLARSSRTLRMMRFLKLFRVTKIGQFWMALMEQVNSNVIHLCITMCILGCILLLLIHISTCIWYAIGAAHDDGWITYDAYEGDKDRLFWYVASFRWVVSQFNGRTDMNEKRNLVERFFTLTVGITLSIVVHALFISIITKTMLDLSEIVSSKTRRRRLVNQYLEGNPLPPTLTSQVKRCLHDYHDVAQEFQREVQVLEILPKHVQTDVLYEVRAPVLMKHHFFNGLRYESPGVMRLVCRTVVHPVSAHKDEVVFDKGDVCDRMLFTDKLTGFYGEPTAALPSSSGMPRDAVNERATVAPTGMGLAKNTKKAQKIVPVTLVESAFGREPSKVRAGAWISEAALWVEWHNQGRFVANGHGMFLGVHASELADALKKHPDSFAFAVVYAQTIARGLVALDVAEWSDTLPFEVQLHSPLHVWLTIVHATGLSSADLFGQPHPYCQCKVIGVTGKSSELRVKTDPVANTLEPVWNHSDEVLISRYQLLEFQVYDSDLAARDLLLGSARLNPDDFYPNGFEGDLALTNESGHNSGFVKVRIRVMAERKTNRKASILEVFSMR